jgi:hypothetical protein
MTSSPDSPFAMWAWPGPNASASIQIADTGQRVLSIFFDPVSLVLSPAPFPNGPFLTARFYRQLARTCAQLSAELDPTGEPIRGTGAHRAEPGSGTGHGGGLW